jgi:ubiquinone/menaquinone biosynthesis C-methylase UbiE
MVEVGRRHADRWDRQASEYDARTAGLERRFLSASRRWMGRRARGATLEIAIGTGANLPYYPDDVTVTGIDLSGGMLAAAADRISDSGAGARLLRADATALPFPADTFDTVVATFALCSVPDVEATLVEALRVLRPGGRLLLADHVAGHWPLRMLQYAVDLFTVPLHGEHFTRRPLLVLRRLAADPDTAVTIEETQRFGFGIIERVQATALDS